MYRLEREKVESLEQKCESALARKASEPLDIMKFCLRLIIAGWRNQLEVLAGNPLLFVSNRLKNAFYSELRRYEQIRMRFGEIQPISSSDAVLRPIDILRYSLMLAKSAICYVFCGKVQRLLVRRTFKGYFQAVLFSDFIERLKPPVVILYGGSYSILHYCIAALLAKKKIMTILYLNSPLLDRDDIMHVDEVVLYHRWQAEHVKKFIHARKCVLGKSECYHLVPPYRRRDEQKRKRIAVYSSGMYARSKFNFDVSRRLDEYVRNEQQMKRLLKEYAEVCPGLVFRIFLHPGIEFREEAVEFYKDILTYPNVEISEDARSQDSFDEYELGLSNISGTLFERIDGGHKSSFIFPSGFDDVFQNTHLKNIVVREPSTGIRELERLRAMPREAYFELIGLK